ncbi:MAG: tRNA (N6-isopentenyl adenosine(37)-C2)-methylthiotransferase MiaB [Fibrobacterales bacterium]
MSAKYHIATYGCQMNVYDSSVIAGMLEKRGFSEAEEVEQADYIVVNTCSIREKAEDTAYARIMQLKPLKQGNKKLKIAVVGCMAKNREEDIPTSLGHVDYILGPDNYKELETIIAKDSETIVEEPIEKPKKSRRPKKIAPVVSTDFDEGENYEGLHARLESPVSSFVAIQRGCNKHCSYCIVPYVRGHEKNRSASDILDEVTMAVDSGIKEVSLLGQTVNSYKYEGANFANLLYKVSQVEGIERVRFTSPHPKHFTDELIWLMGNIPQISNHVHLPLQSGSSVLLRKMKRQYTREDFLLIAEKLRKIDPHFAITTDIIVGFVEETEVDYQETLSLVRQIKFDSAFMFAYSPRKGTKAYDMEDTVSEALKQERLQKLIELQNSITMERTKLLLGEQKKILIEGASHKNPNEMIGKTECFKKVILSEDSSIGVEPGQIITAQINDINGWTLRGEALSTQPEIVIV